MKNILLSLIAVAMVNSLELLPVGVADSQLKNLRSAFSDKITDCKFEKADFHPLIKEGS